MRYVAMLSRIRTIPKYIKAELYSKTSKILTKLGKFTVFYCNLFIEFEKNCASYNIKRITIQLNFNQVVG